LAKPKSKRKATPKAAKKATRSADADLAFALEELEAAHSELARIASDENVARRELEAKGSAATTTEERLRHELDALHVDLRTALADLEIARAQAARERDQAQKLAHELAESREYERLATHAGDRAREESAALKAELEKLRAPKEHN
jgi:hypothetical protein